MRCFVLSGHFYLYWGPVPGVILAAIKFITYSLIEDQALVVGFMIGIAGVMAWLIFAMRRRFFPNSSPFLQLLLTVACSLNLYFMWIIGQPGVYEAAILGGQFYPVKAVAMM